MPDYPPLTAVQLRQLYEQNPSRECRRLLWEIDRLHQRIAEVHYFLHRIDGANLPAEFLVDYSRLVAAIDDEPGTRRQLACKYGVYIYDQWSVDDLLAVANRDSSAQADAAGGRAE